MLKDYFTDLGFYHKDTVLGARLLEKKNLWTLVVYVLVTAGIFCRQITNFPKVSMNVGNLNWSVFFASLIVGFALLPYVMRLITKNRPNPGLEHTLTAFGIGFFIDLTSNAIVSFFLH